MSFSYFFLSHRILRCSRILRYPGVFRHGGYAEYVTLRTEAVVAIPDGMDPAEVAPLMCAGITTFNSLRNMSAKPPQFVAIQGIGYVRVPASHPPPLP